ncbi:MAG: phosphatase PAP2 family protein, partial [Propionibacteriaceae bacterium]|nr:phosphatase PAP2 family protein [Propionibacteriaceae bacterium]
VGDALSVPVSWLTDVPRAIAVTAAASASVYAATGDGRKAALPGAAVALASAVHVASSLVVGRARPSIERIGTRQVTSSYPSGHVGAATAQGVALAMLVAGLPPARRRLARAACLAYPLAVGWSRLYTGQHYVTDCVAGFVNGAACASLARRVTGA